MKNVSLRRYALSTHSVYGFRQHVLSRIIFHVVTAPTQESLRMEVADISINHHCIVKALHPQPDHTPYAPAAAAPRRQAPNARRAVRAA